MSEVHVVVPAGIDDPARPSGGNIYDRRLCDELARWGWSVREHLVPGSWPSPDPADQNRFKELLAGLPDRSVVLVDGLIASAAESLVGAAGRLRVVVLLHMPNATERTEAAVFRSVAAVVTTSQWSRGRVIAQHGLPVDRVWAAIPGVDPVRPAVGSASGRNLLVVGPVTPAKGHDMLIAALAEIADLDWHCTCVGALDLAPDFVASLAAEAQRLGISDRIEFTGPLSRAALDDIRSQADLLVSASRREAFGMAVAEGLAAGIPVIATDVGGQCEAVGCAPDGTVPGALIPVDDAKRLASDLRRWLTDPAARNRWRNAASQRSEQLASWAKTAQTVSTVLSTIAG